MFTVKSFQNVNVLTERGLANRNRELRHIHGHIHIHIAKFNLTTMNETAS